MKEGSKFTITANGEQSVMIAGTSTMLVSFADSLVLKMRSVLIKTVHSILVKDQERFGWMTSSVEVMSRGYLHAVIMDGVITTALNMKMQEFAVEFVEVRINLLPSTELANMQRAIRMEYILMKC